MAENWNFHNHIAIPLERIAHDASTKEYTANEIETGAFVEAMLSVLSIDSKKLPIYATFFGKCNEFFGKRKSEIPNEEAKKLFEAFKLIIQK